MKDPHNINNYEKTNATPADNGVAGENAAEKIEGEGEGGRAQKNPPRKYKSKKAPSGAYYYCPLGEDKLKEYSSIRNILTVLALMIQTANLFIPQAGIAYITEHYPSYAYCYAIYMIFGVFGTSIWLIIMNSARYKMTKRIPVERAPKNGFRKRAYFGAELFMATNAAICVFELSFVCFDFDGGGLGALFVSLAALAASVAARQINHVALKDCELIPAPDGEGSPE